MQEFLTNNTVNCNLMSLTGYRTLVLLKSLLESPKSIDEINEYFLNNQYIQEKFSTDTLRIYINSLREIGCKISRANKSNAYKYELTEHPFCLKINKTQIKALSKLYKSIHNKIKIEEAINIEKLFEKLSYEVNDEKIKENILGLKLIKQADLKIVDQLMAHCKKKHQIIFLHKSNHSGITEIEIIADKLKFRSEKLYILGQSITHNEYSFYRVDKIIKILAQKIKKDSPKEKVFKVICEIEQNPNYQPNEDERILSINGNKTVIEITSKNEFDLKQRLLYDNKNLKILEPEHFKKDFIKTLEEMQKIYEEK